MARRMLKPDLRPSWSDPNIPVAFETHVYSSESGVTWAEVSQTCQYRLEHSFDLGLEMPYWKNDPTYNARKKR